MSHRTLPPRCYHEHQGQPVVTHVFASRLAVAFFVSMSLAVPASASPLVLLFFLVAGHLGSSVVLSWTCAESSVWVSHLQRESEGRRWNDSMGGGACAHYKKRGDFKKLPNTLLCKTDYKFEKSVHVQVRKNMMEYVNPSRRGRIESLSELSMKDMLPYEVWIA